MMYAQAKKMICKAKEQKLQKIQQNSAIFKHLTYENLIFLDKIAKTSRQYTLVLISPKKCKTYFKQLNFANDTKLRSLF